MSLLSIIFLSTIIYLLLIIPLFVGLFTMYYIGKQIDIGDVSLGVIAKILGFYFISGLLFFLVFTIFTIRPFYQFTFLSKNPFLNIFILFILFIILAYFFVLHFKTFFLFVRKFYNIDLTKKIFFYISTTITIWFLVSFYFPVIKLLLFYSEIAMNK